MMQSSLVCSRSDSSSGVAAAALSPVLRVTFLIIAALVGPSARPALAQSDVLFTNDGSSLADFACYKGDPPPIVDVSDGNPAPCLDFQGYGAVSWGLMPYTLPGLGPGEVFHGSLDFKFQGTTGEWIQLAGFGNTQAPGCMWYDGRLLLPNVGFDIPYSLWGWWTTNQAGALEWVMAPDTLSLAPDTWHTADFFLRHAADVGYEWEQWLDGAMLGRGRSYEPIGMDEHPSILIGIGGSGTPTRVRYDNVRVEIVPACSYGPVGDPLLVTRVAGVPRSESFAWSSCGGTGTMTVRCDHASSAWVHLNGVAVVDPADLNPGLTIIAVPVELAAGDNRLDVELLGEPGSTLTFELAATP